VVTINGNDKRREVERYFLLPILKINVFSGETYFSPLSPENNEKVTKMFYSFCEGREVKKDFALAVTSKRNVTVPFMSVLKDGSKVALMDSEDLLLNKYGNL
jgi:hypothetical protein